MGQSQPDLTYNDFNRVLFFFRHFSDVMPPDEHVDHVNNSAYTNAAVQLSLYAADYASQLLHPDQSPQYQQYTKHMYIPYDSNLQYHPEYDGFVFKGRGII